MPKPVALMFEPKLMMSKANIKEVGIRIYFKKQPLFKQDLILE